MQFQTSHFAIFFVKSIFFFLASSVVWITIDNFEINFLSSQNFLQSANSSFFVDRMSSRNRFQTRWTISIRHSSKFMGINDNKNPFMYTIWSFRLNICSISWDLFFRWKMLWSALLLFHRNQWRMLVSALLIESKFFVLLLAWPELSFIAVKCARSIEWEK